MAQTHHPLQLVHQQALMHVPPALNHIMGQTSTLALLISTSVTALCRLQRSQLQAKSRVPPPRLLRLLYLLQSAS